MAREAASARCACSLGLAFAAASLRPDDAVTPPASSAVDDSAAERYAASASTDSDHRGERDEPGLPNGSETRIEIPHPHVDADDADELPAASKNGAYALM